MTYLLTPLRAGSTILANRLVMPPMATAKAGSDGQVSQSVLDYYAEKSQGGYLSLIIIEHSYVKPEGKASNNQLSVSDDGKVQGIRKLAEVIHRNGPKAAMQINHAGSAATREIIGTTPLAPSAVANPRRGDIPREMTPGDLCPCLSRGGPQGPGSRF
jgi:2,4-dienoyl-CoA reductase-like NADH-dependent reductase (Old Yellow Enzyme family)